jgi:hypothetical protein
MTPREIAASLYFAEARRKREVADQLVRSPRAGSRARPDKQFEDLREGLS